MLCNNSLKPEYKDSSILNDNSYAFEYKTIKMYLMDFSKYFAHSFFQNIFINLLYFLDSRQYRIPSVYYLVNGGCL